MAEFDLAAARAKRGAESKTLVLRGPDGEVLHKYDLAPEFPAMAMDAGAKGDLPTAIRALFLVDDEAEAFMAEYKPSVDDLLAIMRDCYGIGTPGES
jgi:hypothetical protein